MRGACTYELEKETKAVRSRLCDKPLKYQMGGRVKQPTVHYDREREQGSATEMQKVGGREQYLTGSSASLLSTWLSFYPFLFWFADIPCEASSGPIVFRLCQQPAWSGGKNLNKHRGVFPIPSHITPLNLTEWNSLSMIQSFMCPSWFLLLREEVIKRMYYSSRAALNVPTFCTTFSTTNTNTPTHKNTNGLAQKLLFSSTITV